MQSKKIIKVCGMRDSENISELLDLDIDMMGMIFYEKSKRFVSEAPKFIKTNVNSSVDKVGVFVNSNLDFIVDKILEFNLDVIQLHGNETPEFCKKVSLLGKKVMKAFGVNDEFNFENIKAYENSVSIFIFDTKTNSYGGSGKKFNWGKLEEYTGNIPFLLSGGIGPSDIDKINGFDHDMCLGLDLNSGFEIEPALKNISLLKEIVDSYKK